MSGGQKPKLTLEQARRIREWAEFGTSLCQVAYRLGVKPATVRKYARGEHVNYREQLRGNR